jgi:hypothetical protein
MSMYELLEDKIYRLENKYYKLLVDISSNKNLKQILLKSNSKVIYKISKFCNFNKLIKDKKFANQFISYLLKRIKNRNDSLYALYVLKNNICLLDEKSRDKLADKLKYIKVKCIKDNIINILCNGNLNNKQSYILMKYCSRRLSINQGQSVLNGLSDKQILNLSNEIEYSKFKISKQTDKYKLLEKLKIKPSIVSSILNPITITYDDLIKFNPKTRFRFLKIIFKPILYYNDKYNMYRIFENREWAKYINLKLSYDELNNLLFSNVFCKNDGNKVITMIETLKNNRQYMPNKYSNYWSLK